MEILYLEDFEPDVKLMHQYFGSVNHHFTSVDTIEKARDHIQKHRPDIFLVDIVIGKATAYDLIEFAVQQKLVKHVVAVTARVLPNEQQQCLDLGCKQVISKPFTIDHLEEVLNELIS
jgi:CheY-like chemotaxis protein